jgi:hypothetical protein
MSRRIECQRVTDVSQQVSFFKAEHTQAVLNSEASVIIYQSTRRNVSEDFSVHQYCCQTLKFHMDIILLNGVNARTSMENYQQNSH